MDLYNELERECEYLEGVVKDAGRKPDLYDDSGMWDIGLYFDYWEPAYPNGVPDMTPELLGQYAGGRPVAGWKGDSYAEVESILPGKILKIIQNSRMKSPYKAVHSEFFVWTGLDAGLEVAVMKFQCMANDMGSDYPQYWYILAVGE